MEGEGKRIKRTGVRFFLWIWFLTVTHVKHSLCLGFQSIFLRRMLKWTMFGSGCGTQTLFLYRSASSSEFSISVCCIPLGLYFLWIFMTVLSIPLFYPNILLFCSRKVSAVIKSRVRSKFLSHGFLKMLVPLFSSGLQEGNIFLIYLLINFFQ